MPILDGLDITARTAGNAIIEDAIQTTRKSIERGETISGAAQGDRRVPVDGRADDRRRRDDRRARRDARKIADFYEDEVDTAVAGMLTLLEPVMIAFLGVVVGGIVIAMYLPIFDLISKMSN